MILLLVGDEKIIQEKAKELNHAHSFKICNALLKDNEGYIKEYIKVINNKENFVFLKHHIMPNNHQSIERDGVYPEMRDIEAKFRKNIAVIYFNNYLNPNNYEINFIGLRLSRLNWLITKEVTPVKEIINNLKNFNDEVRVIEL